MERTVSAVFCSLALLALSAAACHSQAKRSTAPTFDGRWWTEAPIPERDGFVAGFTDCYRYDLEGPAHFEAKSLADYRELVSRYFSRDSTRLSHSAFEALVQSADRVGERPPSGGEVWNERHGHFDGNYWRQAFAAGGTQEQLGFVEGYVTCSNHRPTAQDSTFSATPADYVRRINQWYEFDTTTGDMNSARESAKIADVLLRFRDTKEE